MNGSELTSINAEHKYSYGKEPYIIESRVIRCGRDFIFVFGGGSAYHLGAVSVGLYHSSLKDQKHYTTTASVISIPGHKEDILARSAALELSRELKTNVTICVGLHIDHATKEDIRHIEKNFNELLKILKDKCPF